MIRCNYCGKEAKLVMGRKIYPRLEKLHGLFFYQCEPCDAYVGTHKNNQKPFGTLANKALRQMRMKCHELFDRLWKNGDMSRGEAYQWLQDKMSMSQDEAHIGQFDEDDCKRLLKYLTDKD